MTQRERVLAIGVGGLLCLVVVNWLFGKYRTAVNTRETQKDNLISEIETIEATKLEGEYARLQMDEYYKRSLPGNKEVARSLYQQWLISIANQNGLGNPDLTHVNTSSIDNLYDRISFRLEGRSEFPEVVDLLHDFYSKDYLHRIRTLDINPNRSGGGFTVKLTIDALSMKNAPEDAPDPGTESWRIDADLASYRDTILNRNFFEPPNQAPTYRGQDTVEAIVGRSTPIPLTFSDPEKKSMRYELVGEAPESVKLDGRSGTLHVRTEEKKDIEVVVKATDPGYPPKSIEQTLIVKIVDPPVEKPPADPPPKFDDASQTVLTALVQGGEEWTAWMRVLTRDTTLKLRIGDEFEIGTIKGKVTDVTARFVEVESEDRRFIVKSGGNLGKAAQASKVD